MSHRIRPGSARGTREPIHAGALARGGCPGEFSADAGPGACGIDQVPALRRSATDPGRMHRVRSRPDRVAFRCGAHKDGRSPVVSRCQVREAELSPFHSPEGESRGRVAPSVGNQPHGSGGEAERSGAAMGLPDHGGVDPPGKWSRRVPLPGSSSGSGSKRARGVACPGVAVTPRCGHGHRPRAIAVSALGLTLRLSARLSGGGC
jgi:hypothetical protein